MNLAASHIVASNTYYEALAPEYQAAFPEAASVEAKNMGTVRAWRADLSDPALGQKMSLRRRMRFASAADRSGGRFRALRVCSRCDVVFYAQEEFFVSYPGEVGDGSSDQGTNNESKAGVAKGHPGKPGRSEFAKH